MSICVYLEPGLSVSAYPGEPAQQPDATTDGFTKNLEAVPLPDGAFMQDAASSPVRVSLS